MEGDPRAGDIIPRPFHQSTVWDALRRDPWRERRHQEVQVGTRGGGGASLPSLRQPGPRLPGWVLPAHFRIVRSVWLEANHQAGGVQSPPHGQQYRGVHGVASDSCPQWSNTHPPSSSTSHQTRWQFTTTNSHFLLLVVGLFQPQTIQAQRLLARIQWGDIKVELVVPRLQVWCSVCRPPCNQISYFILSPDSS